VRVLITREQAEPLAGMFRERGLEWAHVPLVALRATQRVSPEGRPTVALVTSAAVVRFVPRLREYLQGARVVAVGQQTATALQRAGVVIASVGTSGGVDALDLLHVKAGDVAWYIGAEAPSAGLDAALELNEIQRWAVYCNDTPSGVKERLASADFDCITFASGSAVRSFVAAVGMPSVPVIVLGRSTRVVAESLGLAVAAMASAPTMSAMADAVESIQLR
jgi:uroporphyrinogen-III synthase